MTASLTMSVVSRNWSADRNRAPSSIAAIVEEIPNSFGIWTLGFGIWDFNYDQQDDSTPADWPVDHVPAHVQAEGGGELSVPEGADVPEIPWQAGVDARRERPREVR